MAQIFVTPKPGLVVRDPATLLVLPAAGALLDDDVHWARRAADGDVTVLDEAARAAAAPSPKAPKPAPAPAA